MDGGQKLQMSGVEVHVIIVNGGFGLVVGCSTVCETSVDADVRLAITGHLLARELPPWTLLSQVHTYVLPLEDHCTGTPRKGPSAGVYT